MNLAGLGGMSEVHDNTINIRLSCFSLRSSVKRQNLFKRVNQESNLNCKLAKLNCVTFLSPTSILIGQMFILRTVFNAVTGRLDKMSL